MADGDERADVRLLGESGMKKFKSGRCLLLIVHTEIKVNTKTAGFIGV